MALFQSPWALGQKPVARPQTAHNTHSQLFIVDVPASGFAQNDILELAVLHPYAHIIDAAIVPVGSLGAATVDIGLMSGETGELLNANGTARTVGAELFTGAAITAMLRLSKVDALLIPATEKPRSIGVKFSAAVAAGAGKKIGLMLHFAQ